jgi:superfamily I DNA and RNA helicase
MLSLAYPKMTAVLLKGIQEQQAELEKKQAQIDSLKEKVRQIQDLKNRLAALEAERSPSALAGLAGSGTGLLLTFLLGGLLGAGLLWRRQG